MKKIFSLLLALLLLTGCAVRPPAEDVPKEPDAAGSSEITDSVPFANMQPEEDGLPESMPEAENSPAEEKTVSLEDFDRLVMIQPYNWYGAPEADGPGVDFGTVALSADGQAEIAILLHPDTWKPAADLPPVGLQVVMSLENSTTGERLGICPWEGATLVMLTTPPSSGVTEQRFWLAPIWLSDDAQRYMYEAAYATWPDPQTMRDLSPLCSYPAKLSPEFLVHIAGLPKLYTVTPADPFLSEYSNIIMPLYYAYALPAAWESAEELSADNLLLAFRSLHFRSYAMTEEFLIDANLADPILQQYFDVSSAHLRTAECFIRDAGCYRMGGADGLGGPLAGPTLLQRIGENRYRMYLEYGESARDGHYFAFDFELTDTGFRYLRGDGMLRYDEHPLPTA